MVILGALRASLCPSVAVAVDVPVRGQHDPLRSRRVDSEVMVVHDDLGMDAWAESPTDVRSSGGRGPYSARSIGLRATDAGILLSCDVRTRSHASRVRRTRASRSDDSVALVSLEGHVSCGRTRGARASAAQQFFRLTDSAADPGSPPCLPNCNLAVRCVDLGAVGGHAEVCSGGDARGVLAGPRSCRSQAGDAGRGAHGMGSQTFLRRLPGAVLPVRPLVHATVPPLGHSLPQVPPALAAGQARSEGDTQGCVHGGDPQGRRRSPTSSELHPVPSRCRSGAAVVKRAGGRRGALEIASALDKAAVAGSASGRVSSRARRLG